MKETQLAADTAKGISVWHATDTVYVQVVGRGTFQNGQPLRRYAQEMIEKGVRRFVVDLGECEGMDSTFLGVLAGAGLRLRRAGEQLGLRVVNVNRRNLELLETLGLDQLFGVDSANPAARFELPASPAFQRLPEYKRDDDWIHTFLQDAKVGHIASSRGDQPFVNPSTFWFDKANHQIIFHSNRAGRIRANIEYNPKVCLEVSELGRLLPSNVALEFSLQYKSVLVFGTARLIPDPAEARRALYGLLNKYFPAMSADKEFRGITDQELRATSVYAIAIEAWSGKENWKERADQSEEWPALDKKWFE